MWDIYWKSVYDELVKNSELYKGLLEENKRLKGAVEIADMCVNNTTKENRKLKEENELLKECNIRNYTSRSNTDDWNLKLLEENEKLKEFKAKQEEMMFLIWASIELAEPKTYRDAEKLQKGKEIYEKLYKKELYYLRKENKQLKEEIWKLVEWEDEEWWSRDEHAYDEIWGE